MWQKSHFNSVLWQILPRYNYMEVGLRWIIYTLIISHQRGWKLETKIEMQRLPTSLFAWSYLTYQSMNSIFLSHQTSQQYFQPWLISQTSPNKQDEDVSSHSRIADGYMLPPASRDWCLRQAKVAASILFALSETSRNIGWREYTGLCYNQLYQESRRKNALVNPQ